MFDITDIRVRLVSNDGNLRAFASFTIDGVFVVHDVRIIEGANGCFVSMPSKRTPNGEFKDIVHPIDTKTREQITSALVAAYEKEKTNPQQHE